MIKCREIGVLSIFFNKSNSRPKGVSGTVDDTLDGFAGSTNSAVDKLTNVEIKEIINANGLTVDEFSELLNPNRVLTSNEKALVESIRTQIDLPVQGTSTTKIVPQSDLYKYLYDDNYDGVRGFVSVEEHSSTLVGLDSVYEGNRLDYNQTQFKTTFGEDGISNSVGAPDTVYGKITYVLEEPSAASIPDWAATPDNAPFTGRGFTGSHNIILPEYVQASRKFIKGDVLEILDSNTGEVVQQFIFDNRFGWILK